MLNFSIKLYHRSIFLGRKIVHRGSSTISFRHPLIRGEMQPVKCYVVIFIFIYMKDAATLRKRQATHPAVQTNAISFILYLSFSLSGVSSRSRLWPYLPHHYHHFTQFIALVYSSAFLMIMSLLPYRNSRVLWYI